MTTQMTLTEMKITPALARALPPIPNDLMTDAELLAIVRSTLSLTHETLARAAKAVCILDQRKSDVSSIPPIYLRLLRKVGGGLLLPDLAVDLLNKPMVSNAVSECPLWQQEKLRTNPLVRVYVKSRNGHISIKDKTLATLSITETHQVFDGQRGLRSEEAKKAWEENRSAAAERPRAPVPRFKLDAKLKIVTVTTPCTLTLAQLQKWVKALTKKRAAG